MSGQSGQSQRQYDDQQITSPNPSIQYGLGLESYPSSLHAGSSQYQPSLNTNYQQSFGGSSFQASQIPPDESTQLFPPPHITAFEPQTGSSGEQVKVSIRSQQNFLSSQGVSLVVNFNGIICPVNVQPLPSSIHDWQYILHFQVPPIVFTETEDPLSCSLQLALQAPRGQTLWAVPFGNFTLERGLSEPNISPSLQSTSPGTQRQREDMKVGRRPRRRSSTSRGSLLREHHDRKIPTESSIYQGEAMSAPVDASYLQRPLAQAYGPIGGEQAEFKAASVPSPPPMSIEGQMSHPSKSMSYPGNQQRRSPSVQAATTRRSPSTTPAQRRDSNPQLVRTSTLNSSAASASFSASPSSSSQPFNPYAMYPSKALLKIDGDLDSMAEDWSSEERDVRRRLVEFKRRQNGNTISTTFRPVTLEERAPNSICVSCIWWEERGDTYVTSVDTIQLLESLVGVRFTVEEKNRIRRNLEGFRPMTVAKGKADSEKFFKTIMDFPNPKPRNIEKDVKVFPWKILSMALKKIIGKYSASYASTASSLHPSSALDYPGTSGPGESSRLSMSPTSASSSTTTSTAQGPGSARPAAAPLAQSPLPGEHLAIFDRQQSYPQYMPHMHAPQPSGQQYMAYGPVEYSWPQQEQGAEAYSQGQHYQGVGGWQYGMEDSPMVTSPAQFGPLQPMSLPIQQRRSSSAQQSYGQYHPQATQGP